MCVIESGKLKAEFRPAVYFDSSVLIDYWMTEGLELEHSDDRHSGSSKSIEPEHFAVVRDLLKTDRRITEVTEIRKRLLFGESRLTAIVSPLSLLELMEWHAETGFKETVAQAVGPKAIERKGKKEIGRYLREALRRRSEEAERQQDTEPKGTTGLEILMSDTWLNPSFAVCHGLQGLCLVDIVNFNLSIEEAWQAPSAFAYLQLGLSDIMHILLAVHLGCEYIASFDSDFVRVSDIIEATNEIRVLGSPDSVLQVLRQ